MRGQPPSATILEYLSAMACMLATLSGVMKGATEPSFSTAVSVVAGVPDPGEWAAVLAFCSRLPKKLRFLVGSEAVVSFGSA